NPFIRHFIANSDFFGLEYYFHTRVRLNPFVSKWGIQYNENKVVSDTGWELYPQGIEPLLEELNLFRKPIYILEHGLADAKDSRRAWYIKESLKQVGRALTRNLDVRGYFHWSLLDNFEWHSGFWPRFGLMEVDYKTLERKIRSSAWEYKKIIEANAIEL
ncbi:MAG: family 1 glycosylhydrolase, partial [Patescibacteria group bacterium]